MSTATKVEKKIVRPKVPNVKEAERAFETGMANPIEKFVYYHAPQRNVTTFRAELQELIDYVKTL